MKPIENKLSTPLKVAFAIGSLEGGGAERVLINILKRLNRDKFMPLLVLLNKKGVYLNEVPKNIKIYGLSRKNIFSYFNIILKLRRIFSKEHLDGILCFGPDLSILSLISKTPRLKVFISEHTISSIAIKNHRFYPLLKNLIRFFYPGAEKVIAVSKGVKKDLICNFSIPESKIVVIHNPIDLQY